jgi:hypothetical protein
MEVGQGPNVGCNAKGKKIEFTELNPIEYLNEMIYV